MFAGRYKAAGYAADYTLCGQQGSSVTSPSLRAELSFRLRAGAPRAWNAFTELWIAFNALYGGEADAKERARVMRAVRRYIPRRDAANILHRTSQSIERIVSLPPGSMRREAWDPRFRSASKRCVSIYRSRTETPEGRLAGVAGVLYQVRSNLVHASKDPRNARDRMLVRESLVVLRELVPALERAMRGVA